MEIGMNGFEGVAMQKNDDHIDWCIEQALDSAADRCEQYGGDIRELQRLRDTAPKTMATVRAIEALYPRPSLWRRLFG